MKRSVIKQANQAYTITLPIEWVRKNKINIKKEVELIDSGKSLIVNSSGSVYGGSVTLNLPQLNTRAIALHIMALYARGVDEVIINSNENISQDIVKSLGNTIGFALVSQENNRYVIRDISSIGNVDFEEIFKRVFQMIQVFYESAFQDIFGKEAETIESLKERDKEVNKFCMYLQRAINKMAYSDPVNGRTLFTYSFALEQLSDEIERMWRTNVKHKVKKSPMLKKMLEDVQEGLGLTFDLYYQFNSSKVQKLYDLRDKVRSDSLKLFKVDPITIRFVRHAVKIIEQTTDLTHLTLMRNL